MNQNDQQGPRILIVGGGLAGLILATRLRRHGLAHEVLKATGGGAHGVLVTAPSP